MEFLQEQSGGINSKGVHSARYGPEPSPQCYYSRVEVWAQAKEGRPSIIWGTTGSNSKAPATPGPSHLKPEDAHTLSLWLLLKTAGPQTFPRQFWASCGPGLALSKEEAKSCELRSNNKPRSAVQQSPVP